MNHFLINNLINQCITDLDLSEAYRKIVKEWLKVLATQIKLHVRFFEPEKYNFSNRIMTLQHTLTKRYEFLYLDLHIKSLKKHLQLRVVQYVFVKNRD